MPPFLAEDRKAGSGQSFDDDPVGPTVGQGQRRSIGFGLHAEIGAGVDIEDLPAGLALAVFWAAYFSFRGYDAR